MLATIPMSVVFFAARRLHLIDELPPHRIVRSVAGSLEEPERGWVAAALHLAIGAGGGIVYRMLTRRRGRGLVSGFVFGIAMWFAAYEGAVPAITDIEPAHRDERRRAVTILVAHAVYGMFLGWLLRSRR
jgi:hypothetical protein